jgi:hypothetical protein
MTREALKLALEAWQTSTYGTVQHHKAMLVAMTEVGKEILAQPDQVEARPLCAGHQPVSAEEAYESACALAPWLSAALDDPKVCAEYKSVISRWFDCSMPYPVAQSEQEPMTDVEFSHFLSDVITAAGLVTYGKQCKALGTRISDFAFRLNAQQWAAKRASQPVQPEQYSDIVSDGGLDPRNKFAQLEQSDIPKIGCVNHDCDKCRAQPKREWVGLTDKERAEVADVSDCFEDIVDATEAKLKEKNA